MSILQTMKNLFFSLLSCCIIILLPEISNAQDFCKTDPSFIKILNDTSYATAMEVTYLPGKATNVHTHPAFFAYVLQGGTLKVTTGDGKIEMLELKEGTSMLSAPLGPHSTINTGNKPVRLLVLEMNDRPYMASGQMK